MFHGLGPTLVLEGHEGSPTELGSDIAAVDKNAIDLNRLVCLAKEVALVA